MEKGLRMETVKETTVVSFGLTAPAWLPAFNEWVGCMIGVATLVYALGRVYWLFKNKGRE